MGLLDVFLKPYLEAVQPVNGKPTSPGLFVDKVDKGLSTTATNGQQIEITNKFDVKQLDGRTKYHQDQILSASRKPHEFKMLREDSQNVDIVACVHENESANFTTFPHKITPAGPIPLGSLARASNIVYKTPACDSCPACGQWDGYGRMRPGRYCFFSAMFKGKTARPVPVAEAQKACPKKDDPDLYAN